MGSGSYSYSSASVRNAAYYAHADAREVFSKRSLDSAMNPKGQIRECCENAEHPETFPIIIGLDVTGSMGHIPAHLIKVDFIEVMKKILEEGIACPQVCFVAYGDHEFDRAPLQIGQFEANDELMEKWLTTTYIEGGGGGNGGESTSLVHYFAARHTICDAFVKRGKKGLLITVGDEPNLKNYPKGALSSIFGDALQADMDATEILDEAREAWDIYHINILDFRGRRSDVQNCWKQLLNDHLINVEGNDDANVSDVIAALAIKSYNEQYHPTAPSTEPSTLSTSPQQML